MPPGSSAARVLVTGGFGFVGRRLRALLSQRHPDWEFVVPARPAGEAGEGLTLDVKDQDGVRRLIGAIEPDIVIHLAAVTTIGSSTRAPREAWEVNFDGTLNIVLALQELSPHAHLLFVSSAEVYGASLRQPGLTDERALLEPLNPYAASKAAADILVRQVAANGLSTCVVRPFNHTGPGQAQAFVAPSFAGQIARIEAGLQPPLMTVGNLDDERDFLDVGDVVSAYTLVLEARERLGPGRVFNVASGKPVRIGDLLEILLSDSRCRIEVRLDPSRLRQATTPRVAGDASKLRRELGWAPIIAFRTTLLEILAEQRAALARNHPA